MENMTELYTLCYQELLQLHAEEKALARQKQDLAAQSQNDVARIKADFAKRRSQLDQDLNTARNHQNAARMHWRGTVSPSSTGQKPDFAQMTQLFVMIDDTIPNDPNARQLLELAVNAIRYLEVQKQRVDSEEAAALQKAQHGAGGENGRLQQAARDLEQGYDHLLSGPLMKRLAAAVRGQSEAYFIDKTAAYDEDIPQKTSPMLKFGVVQRPFPVRKVFVPRMAAMFGVYYDQKAQTLRLPYGFRTDKGVKILLRSPDAMMDRVQTALKGILFNILRHYQPLGGRVVYLDPATYNPDHLGVMKHFAGTNRLITFPKSDAEALRALEQLIAKNSGAPRENRFLIVRGYPGTLSGNVRDKIRNICNNAAQYQITVLMTQNTDHLHRDPLDEAAMNGALNIGADGQNFFLIQKERHLFSFFTAPNSMKKDMVQRFDGAYTPQVLGSEYPRRVDLKHLPPYTKGSKKIRVPFGVNESDALSNLDFYNTNFSTYLMGASGSGKSTMLHTIITGLIRNYHPDDVELWLADFKMGEFSQYINPMPPHIKYILLDESPELIYDFIDLLTEKLMERKRFFATHTNYKELESVPNHVYMPVIFVIMDEFIIMSQVIAESEHYKQLLEDLLVQGRNAGFKFIFASQEYSKGVAGLSATAKDQVQSRIAMKNSVDEIKNTLDIPNLTSQQRDWVDTLPPHAALYKSLDYQTMTTRVERAQVLYFPKQGTNRYQAQQNMIAALKKQLRPVTRKQYNPNDSATYVEKQPVVADGTSYHAFSRPSFLQSLAEFRRANPDDIDPEDVFLSLGSPRRLLDTSLIKLMSESRENLLLLTGRENACAMAVIWASVRSFLLQKGSVQIWTYRRSRLYKIYRTSHFSKCTALETPEDIGAAVVRLKENIKNRVHGNELIVLLGMDRVCEDLEQAEPQTGAAALMQQCSAVSPEEQAKVDLVQQMLDETADDISRIWEEGIEAGKSDDEIQKDVDAFLDAYYQHRFPHAQPAKKASPQPEPEAKPVKIHYLEELRYILTHGSRYGYHFLAVSRDWAEFRSVQPFKLELFRHRLAFQISQEDSGNLFGNTRAARLPQHICQYLNDYHSYTFRPFLHRGITWDDWEVDQNGNATHYIYKPT